MECQIVPARKVEMYQPKKKNIKHRPGKCDTSSDELNGVFTLQPIFKPPKSTLDLEKQTDKNNMSNSYCLRKNFDRNRTDLGFNHFTMSRPGALKSPETSPTNNTTNEQCKNSPSAISYKLHVLNSSRRSNVQSTQVSGPGARNTGSAGNKRTAIPHHYRRASSGEELIHAASRRQTRKPEFANANGYNSGLGGSKSLASSPRPQLLQDSQRRKSAGSKLTTSQASKESDAELREQAMRRKSLFDSHACTKWYSPERRPVSTERVERSRRNVISPTTLSRLFQTFRQQNGDDGVGGGQLSVCTEDDWKTYGLVFPNRKLVSHKKLIKGSSLPYNDNIGLEETVTLDQAKKMAKLEQYKEWKKQQKPSSQTPKQVWYRTVRSVMAVNHLYHQVQCKNQAAKVK